MRMVAWCIFAALAGCGDRTILKILDDDGDGFYDVEAASVGDYGPYDCDDTDSNVHPGGIEVCNGADDDCNGTIDDGEDRHEFFADLDDDGFGNADVMEFVCVAPEGFLEDSTDCDDADEQIFPGAVEVCNGADDNCDGQTDDNDPEVVDVPQWFEDADGDRFGSDADTIAVCAAPSGYVDEGGDCNDANAAVNPLATETCTVGDENCNALADDQDPTLERPTAWYVDADSDGYGVAEGRLEQCLAPAGYAQISGDCNDAAAGVHPGVAEVCNGVDDNCNEAADEGVQTTYYRDLDFDGYGDGLDTLQACAPPSGYVTSSTDCRPTDALGYPGAPERCNDFDDNCDIAVDENPVDPATWWYDGDKDKYGGSQSVVACDAPVNYVAANGDCDDGRSGIHPGAREICGDGLDNDCDLYGCEPHGDLTVDDAQLMITGELEGDRAGQSFEFGDFDDSDRGDELLLGAPGNKDAAYVVPFEYGTDRDIDLNAVAEEISDDAKTVNGYGAHVATCALRTSATTDDALVQYLPTTTTSFIYGYFGPITTSRASLSPSVIFAGADPDGQLGSSMVCGDISGDNRPDLVAGARYADNAPASTAAEGAVYVFRGAASYATPPSTQGPALTFKGISAGDYAGDSVAVCDISGDGKLDLVIAAPGVDYDNTAGVGAVYVFKGPITAGGSLSSADSVMLGSATGDIQNVDCGDIDGDGRDDLVVGGTSASVVYGSTRLLPAKIGSADLRIDVEGDARIVGDVNGDGQMDFATFDTAFPVVLPGCCYAGRVTLWYGRRLTGSLVAEDADARWIGPPDQDFGTPGVIGDVHGDGLSEFGIGAPSYPDVQFGRGAIYVFAGNAL